MFQLGQGQSHLPPQNIIFNSNRFLHDNLLAVQPTVPLLAILLLLGLVYLWRSKKQQTIFLMLMYSSGLIPYLLSGVDSYYYSAGTTVSLFILAAFFVYLFWTKKSILSLFILITISLSNLYLDLKFNPQGVNPRFYIQPGMLLKDETRVLDYIYQDAAGKPFAVRALTVPLNINTTWSYLFEWYGKQRYGYLPVWDGSPSAGFPGNLPSVAAKSKLPPERFTIIEPTVGIRASDITSFFQKEDYFTTLLEEKKLGTITVQKRTPIIHEDQPN